MIIPPNYPVHVIKIRIEKDQVSGDKQNSNKKKLKSSTSSKDARVRKEKINQKKTKKKKTAEYFEQDDNKNHEIIDLEAIKDYECRKCDNKFYSRSEYDQHRDQSKSDGYCKYPPSSTLEPFCSVCGLACSSTLALYAHQELKHRNKVSKTFVEL